jgi:hypothetical protein
LVRSEGHDKQFYWRWVAIYRWNHAKWTSFLLGISLWMKWVYIESTKKCF